jgi:histidine triad (HIT) family protein
MIINGDLPGHFVWRDEHAVGFLSINPINRGHTLIVPRTENEHWVDLPTSLNQHLMAVAQHVGSVQQEVFRPARIGLIIAGFEVPHVHVHCIPIDNMGHLDFARAATDVDQNELMGVATQIREGLAAAGHGEASD